MAVCVIWTSGTNDNACLKCLESVLQAINFLSKQLTSKVTIKQIWQRFQVPFGQSEFVQILTKIFCLSVMVFSVDPLRITAVGKVAVKHACKCLLQKC